MSDFEQGFGNDVNNDEYSSAELNLNGATPVEATTGNVEYRQWVRIYNKGNSKVEFGPQAGPWEPLFKNQGVTLNHGPDLPVYVRVLDGSGNATVLVQESG